MGLIGRIFKAGRDFLNSDIVKGAVAGEALSRGIDAIFDDDEETDCDDDPQYQGALETAYKERTTSFWDDSDDSDSFKGALDIEIEEREDSYSFFDNSSSSDDDDW